MERSGGYWDRQFRRGMGRRAVLKAGTGVGAAAALTAFGCGDDDDDEPGGSNPTTAPDATTAPTAAPKPGGTLQVASTGALGTLDPHNASNGVATFTTSVVYNALLRSSSTQKGQGIIWDLGTGYENPDGNTWTFKLRPDVMVAANDFGIPVRPLDATDVKMNIERIADAKVASPGFKWASGWVDKVEAMDPTTVKITTVAPYAWLLAGLGHYQNCSIAPREFLSNADIKTKAAGGGPFTISEWANGKGARLKKNPAYYLKGQPYLDEYVVNQFSDQVTTRTAFLAGSLDVYAAADSDEAKSLKDQQKGVIATESFLPNFQGFWMNTRGAPWNDPRVRRAVSLAMNSQEFLALAGKGKGKLMGPVPPAFEGYGLSDAELKQLRPFDVAQAKKLFEEAGVKEFSFTHSTSGSVTDYATIFVRQMQAAGVTVTAQPLDAAAWVQGLFNFKHTATNVSTPDFSDPDYYINGHGTKGFIGTGNYSTGFSDAEVDAAIKKAASTLDEKQRIDAYLDAQRLILKKDPAFLPYFNPVESTLMQPHVRNYKPETGKLASAFVRDTWIDKG
jgi:peptide/nickel transport system substrate-binding protein